MIQRRSHPAAPDLDQLTPREREILRLVGTGRTNTEIADDLTVREATIKTHLNRTMTKLGLAGRAQAVVVAYETGLVTPATGPVPPAIRDHQGVRSPGRAR